jgi:hypothetical protein
MTCIHRLFDENGRRRGAAGHAVIWSLFLSMFTGTMSAQAQVVLADQPVFAGGNVPGNLALTLSVEFPTAISVANLGNYVDNMTFAGYFDPVKCYTYMYNSATPAASYFQPTSFATGPNSHQCTGLWSGNFMNWATMQTIDPFRWALSGGYRSVDQAGLTILEKAWAPDWYNPAEGNNPQYSHHGGIHGHAVQLVELQLQHPVARQHDGVFRLGHGLHVLSIQSQWRGGCAEHLPYVLPAQRQPDRRVVDAGVGRTAERQPGHRHQWSVLRLQRFGRGRHHLPGLCAGQGLRSDHQHGRGRP